MGLFRRKPPKQELQVPDELARQASMQYGERDFAGALETYGEAIDKIHTMCVVAERSSRIRTPGPQDQGILDGFNNSLGAALALDPQAKVASTVQRTLGYLRQIADEAGPESGRYRGSIDDIETTIRLSSR